MLWAMHAPAWHIVQSSISDGYTSGVSTGRLCKWQFLIMWTEEWGCCYLYLHSIEYSLDKGCNLWREKRKRRKKKKRRKWHVLGRKSVERCCPEIFTQTPASWSWWQELWSRFPKSLVLASASPSRYSDPFNPGWGAFLNCVTLERSSDSFSEPLVLSIWVSCPIYMSPLSYLYVLSIWHYEYWSLSQDGCGH